jgi:hypothetical protein
VTATSVIWPNFFIVGAAKCGTTSLYAELKKHPEVFLPDVKEPHYFITTPPLPTMRVRQEHRAGDREGYLRLYENARSCRAIGDASPSYLWDEGSARRIHEVSPAAKIVVILRDPVTRAHSQFQMNHLVGTETDSLTFLEALRRDQARQPKGWWAARLYIELGMYAEQVSRFHEVFGSDQVLVVLSEDLKRNPQKLYSEIARHIGVDPGHFATRDISEAHNASRTPRFLGAYHFVTKRVNRELRDRILPAPVRQWLRSSPLLYGRQKAPLDDEARRFLQKIYDPDITDLEQLLERKLPELRKSWT